MNTEGVLSWQRKSKKGVWLCTPSSENNADKGGKISRARRKSLLGYWSPKHVKSYTHSLTNMTALLGNEQGNNRHVNVDKGKAQEASTLHKEH